LPEDLKVVRQSSAGFAGGQLVTFEPEVGQRGRLAGMLYQLASPAQAASLRERRIIEVLSVFKTEPEPYFAAISKSIQCPGEFQPKREVFGNGAATTVAVSAYGSERNTLGACTKSEAVKRATFIYLACGNNLLQMERFIPVGDGPANPGDWARQFGCRQ
jgi:hypothetical protein